MAKEPPVSQGQNEPVYTTEHAQNGPPDSAAHAQCPTNTSNIFSVRLSSDQEITERSVESVPLSSHGSSQEPTVQFDAQGLHLSTAHFQTVHRQADFFKD